MHGIAVQVKIRRRLGGLVQGTNGLHHTGFSLALLYHLWLASRRPQMLKGSRCATHGWMVLLPNFQPGKQIRGVPTGPLQLLVPIFPNPVDHAWNERVVSDWYSQRTIAADPRLVQETFGHTAAVPSLMLKTAEDVRIFEFICFKHFRIDFSILKMPYYY